MMLYVINQTRISMGVVKTITLRNIPAVSAAVQTHGSTRSESALSVTIRGTHSTTLPKTTSGPTSSRSISFDSPEADFLCASFSTSSDSKAADVENLKWSHTLSFSSPESDWCANTAPIHQQKWCGVPETFREVLQHETDQAIVVTTLQSPHVIIHVNAAWENLCGYTKAEAVHGSLSLIQGPDWNGERAKQMKQMVQRVVETRQPQETILVNCSKSGRPFTNHLTVGPLHLKSKHSQDELQFLVGVLEEVPGEGNFS
jgi:PAS domain S-box-containing protein